MRSYDSPANRTAKDKKTSPLPPVPHSGSPQLHSSRELRRGMKMLEDFGFRTDAGKLPSPRLSMRLGECEKQSEPLVHVTDLWSQRQQKEFLHRTGLRRAQLERERQVRREALFAARDKIEDVHTNDQLYDRILAEDDPAEAGKMYAAGTKGRLLKQLRNQLSANSQKVTIPKCQSEQSMKVSALSKGSKTFARLNELVSKCDDTIHRASATREELHRTYCSFLDFKARIKTHQGLGSSFDLSVE